MSGRVWASIGLWSDTKRRFEKAKEGADAESVSDDAFLNMLLDALEEGVVKVRPPALIKKSGA